MKKSVFQFSNPTIEKFCMRKNDNFKNEHFNGMSMENEVGISIIKEDEEAIVSLTIRLGDEDEKFPFYIDMMMSAAFKMEKDGSKEDFEKYLKVNAPALLLSYSRPVISMMTAQSGLPAFYIPFVNFSAQNE